MVLIIVVLARTALSESVSGHPTRYPIQRTWAYSVHRGPLGPSTYTKFSLRFSYALVVDAVYRLGGILTSGCHRRSIFGADLFRSVVAYSLHASAFPKPSVLRRPSGADWAMESMNSVLGGSRRRSVHGLHATATVGADYVKTWQKS